MQTRSIQNLNTCSEQSSGVFCFRTCMAMMLSMLLVVSGTALAQAADQQSGFEARIDELLPGIAAEKIEDRAKPQMAFEKICIEAAAPGKDAEREALCKAILARCGSDIAMPARVWLLRKLETISGEESVDGLKSLLSDTDGQIRELARRALMNNPSARAGQVLSTALAGTQDSAWRVALVQALGFRHEPESLAALGALTSDADTEVARASLSALARIPAVSAAMTIIKLETPRPDLQAAQHDALLRAAETIMAHGDKVHAAKVYESLWATNMPEAVRIAALRGLVVAEGASRIPMLVELLVGPDPRWAIIAEQCLHDMSDPAATKIMGQLGQLASPETHAAVLGIIARRGDRAALPAILADLGKFDEQVNVAALKAVALIGDRSAVGPLIAKALGGTRDEQQAARESLAVIADRGVDEELLSLLKESAPPAGQETKDWIATQSLVADVLVQRRTPGAAPAFFELAAGQDAKLADTAVKALGKLAGDQDLPRMLKLMLASGDAKKLAELEQAAIAICLRSGEPAGLADPLVAAMADAAAPAKAAIIRILGRIEGDKALAEVSKQCQAQDPAVRQTAVLTLTSWTNPAAMDALLEVAKTDPDRGRRESALLHGIRLAAKPTERTPQATFDYLKTAMTTAQQPGIKAKAVASMGHAGCLEALNFLMPLMDDAELKSAALPAVAEVAIAVMGQKGEAAKSALARVRRETQDEKVLARVDQALDLMNKYVIAWQWSGPYRQDGKNCDALFDIPFGPETGDTTVPWQPLPVRLEPKPGVFQLGSTPPPGDCCGYIKTTVIADKAQKAVLTIGSDDGAKVWLRNKVVHANNVRRPTVCGDDKISVDLQKGPNPLLIKITQGGGEWSFCCTLQSLDGAPLTTVSFQAN